MQPKDILEPLLKLGLPLLGAALPIPGGAALGAELAAHIGSPSSKPEDIIATLQASADAVLKAKQFEAENRTRILELTLAHEERMFQAEVDDRKSAREREASVKDKMPAVLAILAVLSGILVSYLIITGKAPSLKDPVTAGMTGTLVGYIFAEVKAVYNYYFGSSVGSKDKDSTIADIAKS